MAAAIKMDELLVSWLGSDTVYENVHNLMESYRAKHDASAPASPTRKSSSHHASEGEATANSPRGVIPPFYPVKGRRLRRSKNRRNSMSGDVQGELEQEVLDTWLPPGTEDDTMDLPAEGERRSRNCVRDQAHALFGDVGRDPPVISPSSADSRDAAASSNNRKFLPLDHFVRVTKDICHFPTFFNGPLYKRILKLWNDRPETANVANMDVVTMDMFEWFWMSEMEPYDAPERFFRLLKQPDHDYVARDDFLPYIKELLSDHPGLEFLSNHAEFQEKYAVTVITRIFYSVNHCHSGRITSRQIRRSDLLDAFQQVDEEEDINKVTRYFSYEHFYVLYCRFWELDHDRDYRITRDDLLKYGDHSLSHMIVDRIFEAAPRPFDNESGATPTDKDYLSYEDFIFFMMSEEDKTNEVSVRYWFTCVDVDGDGRLNNMEMRSFYAVQLHRMQCMGHEIVPFEDMLCQMMDMIKPATSDYLVAEDFLQQECAQVSGALFDALFNLNKYLTFEQRDPFVERQKREDEFETDWDRFTSTDYNRLAMEEEVREEEAMEVDWVTVDDEEDGEGEGIEFSPVMGTSSLVSSSEAPF